MRLSIRLLLTAALCLAIAPPALALDPHAEHLKLLGDKETALVQGAARVIGACTLEHGPPSPNTVQAISAVLAAPLSADIKRGNLTQEEAKTLVRSTQAGSLLQTVTDPKSLAKAADGMSCDKAIDAFGQLRTEAVEWVMSQPEPRSA